MAPRTRSRAHQSPSFPPDRQRVRRAEAAGRSILGRRRAEPAGEAGTSGDRLDVCTVSSLVVKPGSRRDGRSPAAPTRRRVTDYIALTRPAHPPPHCSLTGSCAVPYHTEEAAVGKDRAILLGAQVRSCRESRRDRRTLQASRAREVPAIPAFRRELGEKLTVARGWWRPRPSGEPVVVMPRTSRSWVQRERRGMARRSAMYARSARLRRLHPQRGVRGRGRHA